MARGKLTIYLGAAPGVGKTYAMLNEAHRRQVRSGEVVVGFVETHGRAHTEEMIAGLEVLPRREVEYRGSVLTEFDLPAALRRRPEVILVDELAHTNAPGTEHAKRWQDIQDLLAAGIDVITTVNVQHLESLNDVVLSITGVRQRETVPDDVARAADQIQLVDMTPEALRRRLAHGNVYRPERIDASLSSYFRVGNLTALRVLALLWLADRVDSAMEDYRSTHEIEQNWPARERIVVAITGGPESAALIRRAARIAKRGAGAQLMAVHVLRGDGLVDGPLGQSGPVQLAEQRELVESLGGSFHSVVGASVAESVVEFATGANATLIVVGVSRRPRWQEALSESVGVQVARLAGSLDVHLVSHAQARAGLPHLPRYELLSKRRLVAGWIFAALGPVLLTVVLRFLPETVSFATQLMLFLTMTVAVAIVGGLWPAVVSAVWGTLLLNFWFAPPRHTFTVSDPENVLALVVFVLVAAAVASVVAVAARRTAEAKRASGEAAILAQLTSTMLRGGDSAEDLVSQLRETFALEDVTLLRRAEGGAWDVVAASGQHPATTTEGADEVLGVTEDIVIVLHGDVPDAADRRVMEAYAAQVGVTMERRALRKQAADAAVLEQSDAIRTALLAAVSHDLRTPLAAIRASVDGLRLEDVEWSPEEEEELLTTVDESTARLESLIDNLLDLSRLQTGAVSAMLRAVSLDEIVPAALEGIDRPLIELDVAENMPLALTDRGLLERVVANIVNNALRFQPADAGPVRVMASAGPQDLQVRVIDRGKGLSDDAKERMFDPFQRLGDQSVGGLGLGLAVASGLAKAVGASVAAEDTPGGGLTMVITVPRAEDDSEDGWTTDGDDS